MATAASPGSSGSRPRRGQPVSYTVLREHHKKAYDLLSMALEIDESGQGEMTAAIDYYSKGVAALEEGIACEVHAEGEEREKAERLKEKMISNLEMARDRVNVLLSGAGLKGSPQQKTPPKRPTLQPTSSLRFHKITPPKEPPNKKFRKETEMLSDLTKVFNKEDIVDLTKPLKDKQKESSSNISLHHLTLAKPTNKQLTARGNNKRVDARSRQTAVMERLSRPHPPRRGGCFIGRGTISRSTRKPAAAAKTSSTKPHPVNNLKGIDPQLAEKILDEIVEQSELSVTWNDVVGLELPKRTLQEIVILPALRPELFTGLRSPARGMLLFGPPGNGKTMLAKAVAHESQAKFFNISASSLTSKWIGDGEKLVKAMFALARELQPSIIFLDEVDALLAKRGGSEHDAMRRIKNEFLQSFDGMHTQEGERILVMAATNRPHELDDAALRRFEKRIYIPLPASQARKTVLEKLISKHQHSLTDNQLNRLASATEGYSGSDLTALAKDAALGPIRELDFNALKSVPANKVRPIRIEDFQRSMRTIRPSVAKDLISTLEQWNTLYGVSS